MKSKLFAPVDMTVGEPVIQIIKFTIPMLLGNVAQQLYNTVDSIIVGRFVGDNALAAVGSAGPILNLMLVLFMGISVGASIMVSQFFGARQRESLSKSIGACVVLTGAASLIIMIVGPLVTMPLLRLLGTPESIIGWCRNYLIIICLGIAGGGYYNILSGVLRGLGDSMSALIYLLVATGINIVLDYVFVAHLGLGVAGVALATVIAQFVSAFLSLRRLTRMTEYFDMKKEYLLPDSDYISQLIRLGVPSGITQAIFSMSMIVVQSLTNCGSKYRRRPHGPRHRRRKEGHAYRDGHLRCGNGDHSSVRKDHYGALHDNTGADRPELQNDADHRDRLHHP